MTTASEWRGDVGRQWAEQADAIDAFLGAAAAPGFAAFGAQPGWRVLDLGCGAGASTRRLAEMVAPEGHVVGVDISPDLLAVARARDPEGRAEYVEADAATHDFGPARFDGLFSRFGAMFFEDPPAAFARLRGAMAPGATLCVVCWRTLAENPWARVPGEAVADILPPPPGGPPQPGAPGPFGWADPGYFAPLLSGAGWRAVDWTAEDMALPVSMGDDPDPVERGVAMALRAGPVAGRLRARPEMAAAAAERLRAALAPHVEGDMVRLGGAVWVVTGRA